jgi:hypothetical protein
MASFNVATSFKVVVTVEFSGLFAYGHHFNVATSLKVVVTA